LCEGVHLKHQVGGIQRVFPEEYSQALTNCHLNGLVTIKLPNLAIHQGNCLPQSLSFYIPREKVQALSDCQQADVLNFGTLVLGKHLEAVVVDLLVSAEGVVLREQLLEALEETDPHVGNGRFRQLCPEEVD